MAGDAGARMLSKALLMNKKLATIRWDRNNTSPQGFADIAAALERSMILTLLLFFSNFFNYCGHLCKMVFNVMLSKV